MTVPAYVAVPAHRSAFGQQVDYNIDVNAAMDALGARQNLDPRFPRYSPGELNEMDHAQRTGIAPEAFAAMLNARDHQVGAA